MEQRSLKRSREDSESREASSRGQSESQERLQRMRRENRLPMQDTGPSQKINDRLGKTALEFLTSEERKNLNSGLHKDTYQRDMKESLAIELFRISVKSKHNNNSDLFIESLLREIRKNNLYKQAYGSEESRPHQQVNKEELNTLKAHNEADQHGSLILLEQIKRGLATLTRQFEVTYQASPSDHLKPRDQVEQTQTTLGEQLYTLEQQSYQMQKQIQAIRKQHQAGLNNLVTRDFLAPLDQEQVMQTQRDEAQRKQQEVGPSRRGDPSSHPDRLELSIDDFELCSMELRKPHDQTQGINSQSLAESQQPFAAHHPVQATHVEQWQETLVQQHEGQDQAGPNDLEKLPLPHKQFIDLSKDEIDYNKPTCFLMPEELENLPKDLNNTHRTPKENLAVEILNTVIDMKQLSYSNLCIIRLLDKIRQ